MAGFEIPVRHRGKCPTCGSPNLHHTFTASQFAAELAEPRLMVLCRVCPDVWVLPTWELEPKVTWNGTPLVTRIVPVDSITYEDLEGNIATLPAAPRGAEPA